MMAWIMLIQELPEQAEAVQEGIGPYALLFMLLSMGAVTLLVAWCFWRILTTPRPTTPEGTDIVGPPAPPEAKQIEHERRSS